MKTSLTQFAALTLLSAVPLAIPSNVLAGDGADWPQWRGPNRTGVSVETGWSTVGKSLWAKPLGFGHSSFAVSNGRLYTMGYDLPWPDQYESVSRYTARFAFDFGATE